MTQQPNPDENQDETTATTAGGESPPPVAEPPRAADASSPPHAEPPPAADVPSPTPWLPQGASTPAVDASEGEIAPAQALARDSGTFGAEQPASRRSSGVRWAIALGGVALVVVVTAAILLLAGGKSNTSVAVGYMPTDTIQYAEYRLDLPGNQRAKLAAFLSKFPGFADQAALDPKLDEVLDRLVGAASQNTQTWTADIKPWFGGQIAMGTGPLDANSTGGALSMFGGGSPLIVITVTDRTKSLAWLKKTTGDSFTESEYNGATLLTPGDNGSAGSFIFAVNDKVLLAGTDATVRAAIDSKGENKLADDAEFKAAFGTVTGDYISFSYTEYRAYIGSILTLMGASSGLGQTTVDDELLAMVPAWQAAVFRFEDDAIVGETTYPGFDVGFAAANKHSTLAAHAPAGSILYAESHDVGAAITALLDRFRQMPDLRDSFGQFDQAAGMIGGVDGMVGWWGDVAAVVSKSADGSIGGGLIIAPTDADKARRFTDTLRSFVVLGGRGAGLEIRDVPHGAATISIVDFSAAVLASGATIPPGVKAEIAFAVTNDIVVFGYGESFVAEVIDAAPGSSLADAGRYKDLLKRVGEENIGVTFVDVQAIRLLVEPLAQETLGPDEWAFYEREIQPYLKPLDALISGARIDGELNRLPQQITVK